MNAGWPVVRLGDFCTKVGSGSTPNGGANVYLEQGDICLIRSQNVHNDGFKPEGLVYITQESADKLRNVVVEENDVLLNITGDSVARVCLAPKKYLPARVNQHVAIIRPDPEKFDSRYLRYLLVSPRMQSLLLSIASIGATRNALTKGMIESLEVCMPPISIQKSIADNLEILDLKIDINTQTNQTLEAIAQAIFKSWFVDFEPVKAKMAVLEAGGTAEEAERAAMCAISGKDEAALTQLQTEQPEAYAELAQTAALFPAAMQDSELGEIPEGWDVSDLKACVTEIRRGISPKYTEDEGIQVVNQKCIRNHSVDFSQTRLNDPAKKKVEGREIVLGDVLVNSTGVGTLGRLAPVRYLSEPTVVDSHVTVVRANTNQISKSFLAGLMFVNEAYIESSGAGSTGQTELRKEVIEEIRFVKPNLSLSNIYESIAHPISSQIAELEQQRLTLSVVRDTLLPKLLSGEIDLSQAADMADEASV
jgi:type I restriction enzyme S subunit